MKLNGFPELPKRPKLTARAVPSAALSASMLLAWGLLVGNSAADPGTEDAAARQQRELRDVLGLDCDRGRSSGEIVVCGKRSRSPYRIRFALDPEPGVRRPGEPQDQREAMALNPKPCPPPARPKPQSEGLDLLAVAATAVTIAAAVADDDTVPVKPRHERICG